MKKLFLSLMVSISFLVAAEEYGLMQSLLDRQTALAVAINMYIEDRGSVPPSITVLKNANYLPLAYDEKNPFDKDALSFNISNYQIRIDSNVESATRRADQVLYYINSINNRDLDRRSTREGGKLISYYALSAKAATNLNLSSYLSYATLRGNIEPNLYQSVTAGAFWFSSTYEDMYKIKLFDGSSWGGLEKGNKNFDSITGEFVNLKTLPIIKSSWTFTNVGVNTLQKTIMCFITGTTYNASKDRCEAYTSSSCNTTYSIFNSPYNVCYRQITNGDCFQGTYNQSTHLCEWTEQVNETSDWAYMYYSGKIVNGADDFRSVNFNDAIANQSNTISSNSDAVNQPCLYRLDSFGGRPIAYQMIPNDGTFSNNIGRHNGGWGTYHMDQWNYNVLIQCYRTRTVTRTALPNTPSGATFIPALNGFGISASCSGKTMPVAPFYPTPYSGNNGVCYSDAGLYCSKTGVSMDGLYTCFNTNFGCDDSTYNLRTDTDVCEKFTFSCSSGHRYGLPESPTNSDATVLYNRITNKDDKLTAIVSTITKNDYNTNDNGGAMCAAVQFTTLSQPIYSPDYTIGGEVKSGF